MCITHLTNNAYCRFICTMSGGDEDTELRDLVTQTLENNGLLGKIQAQLRAGVFLALEETDKTVSLSDSKFATD